MFNILGPNIFVDNLVLKSAAEKLYISTEQLFLNKEYLMEKIINDSQMTSELLINARQRKTCIYSFYLQREEKTPLTIEISIEEIKEYLRNNSNSNDKNNKNNVLLKDLEYYESKEYAENTLLNKVVFDNYTRKDLVSILKQKPEDFLEKMETDSLEIPKNKLYKIFLDDAFSLDLDNHPKRIMEPIFSNVYPRYIFDSLTEEEKENVIKNVSEILFYINIGRMIDNDITFNRGHVDEFNTPELLKEIKTELKEDYSDVQKTRYVYGALCQDLSYDENFYMNGQFSNDIIHSDISRLNNIKKGDLVTCNEITMLVAKYLDEEKLPYTIVGYAPNNGTLTDALSMQENDYNTHLRIIAKIDYHLVLIDPAHGLFQSDLANAKLSNSTVSFKSLMPYEYFDGLFKEEIEAVEEDLQKRKPLKEQRGTELYEALKNARKEDLTNKDRIDLFFLFLKSVNLNSFDSFNWTKGLKSFLGENGNIINVEYIINKEPYKELLQGEEFDLCVSVNEDGLVIDKGDEMDVDQRDSNKYYIYYKGEEQEQLTREQLQEKFSSGVFRFSDSGRKIPGIELEAEEKNK